jgi:hypothetical protein
LPQTSVIPQYYSKENHLKLKTIKLNLKKCDNMVETYEEKIEDWYKTERDKRSLTDYLCEQILVGDEEKACLKEVFVKTEQKDENKETTTTKKAQTEAPTTASDAKNDEL